MVKPVDNASINLSSSTRTRFFDDSFVLQIRLRRNKSDANIDEWVHYESFFIGCFNAFICLTTTGAGIGKLRLVVRG